MKPEGLSQTGWLKIHLLFKFRSLLRKDIWVGAPERGTGAAEDKKEIRNIRWGGQEGSDEKRG